MHKKSQRVLLQAIAWILLAILSGCGILTVERIVDENRLPTKSPQLDPTSLAIEEKIEQQDDLIEYLATQVSGIVTQNAMQDAQLSYLATRGPAPVTPAGNPPPTPIPVIVGSVEIEGGDCCIGATVGEELDITARFTAIGLDAPATEMRYITGSYAQVLQELLLMPWEPFTDELAFTYQVPINWTGFYVRVQYRDSLGNTSPIYTDDISVEGMPPLTPSPGE